MILNPSVKSSSPIQINYHLVQGEDFDPLFIRYTDLSKKKRFDFTGYSAKLEIFDDIYPENHIYCSTQANRGISLFDGEIRIYIPAHIIDKFDFDRAQYTLTLYDKYNNPHIFMKGLVFLELRHKKDNPCGCWNRNY